MTTATYFPGFSPQNMLSRIVSVAAQRIKTWWNGYRVWRNRQLAMAALQRLDNKALRDIGLDRSEISSVINTGGKQRHGKFKGH